MRSIQSTEIGDLQLTSIHTKLVDQLRRKNTNLKNQIDYLTTIMKEETNYWIEFHRKFAGIAELAEKLQKISQKYTLLCRKTSDSTDRLGGDDRAEAPAGGLCRTASWLHWLAALAACSGCYPDPKLMGVALKSQRKPTLHGESQEPN